MRKNTSTPSLQSMVQATEKSHLVQVLSSGYVNFIQVYDIMHGLIFVSEFAENEKLACQTSKNHFPKSGDS